MNTRRCMWLLLGCSPGLRLHGPPNANRRARATQRAVPPEPVGPDRGDRCCRRDSPPHYPRLRSGAAASRVLAAGHGEHDRQCAQRPEHDLQHHRLAKRGRDQEVDGKNAEGTWWRILYARVAGWARMGGGQRDDHQLHPGHTAGDQRFQSCLSRTRRR